ncbi:MAG: recombination regulator RecX [Pseudomonadota bacterium]|nr:recombination regulator RecX [Pseudomonadota bacterium]
MDLLARREHGVDELALKLRQKGFEPADITVALKELVAENLLSDERFAFEYTRSRHRRGFGPRRISLELQERGIAAELIRTTLAEYRPADWQKAARAVWQKKFGCIPTDFKVLANQKRFLVYRGFGEEHCEWLGYENQ